MNNDKFYIGYETGEADAKNGAEPMVFDYIDYIYDGDFIEGYEMAYYNNKTLLQQQNEGEKTMSFDAEKEWKSVQIAEYSKNIFLKIVKDRKPYECLAIIHALMDMLFITTGCEEKAIRDFGNKFPELIDEVFVKSGVKK